MLIEVFTQINHIFYSFLLIVGILRRRIKLLEDHSEKKESNFAQALDKAVESWNKTPNKTLNEATPQALRSRKPEALEKYEAKIRPLYTWKERQAHFLKSINKFKWLVQGIWVRISTVAKDIFEKSSARHANNLELFKVIKIRWPTIANKTLFPYVTLQDFNGETIRGEFRAREIIQTNEDPTKPSFRGTVTAWLKVPGGISVSFAGEAFFTVWT